MATYLFDIDGTLCDVTHRLGHIQKKPADWDAFFAACVDDLPIPEVIDVARALKAAGHNLVLVSGRSDSVRQQTAEWFRDRDIYIFKEMYMRKADDHRQDNIVKEELLDEILKTHPAIAGVFEDRQQVVDMYRARGIRVFQVAEGKY